MISTGGQMWIFLLSGGGVALFASVQYRDAPRFSRDKLWRRAMSDYMVQRSKPQAWLYRLSY